MNIQTNDGYTAFILAAGYGYKEVCESLMSHGCTVDIQTNDGDTALIWSATNGHVEVCESLISRGCNLDIQNNNGETALIMAALNGHIPAVISLIQAGCNYSLTDGQNKSAMDWLEEKHPDEVEEVQVTHLLTHRYYSSSLLLAHSHSQHTFIFTSTATDVITHSFVFPPLLIASFLGGYNNQGTEVRRDSETSRETGYRTRYQ